MKFLSQITHELLILWVLILQLIQKFTFLRKFRILLFICKLININLIIQLSYKIKKNYILYIKNAVLLYITRKKVELSTQSMYILFLSK